MEIVRQKVDLIKDSDPNSTTFARLCVESPLSDDMLARVRNLKRSSATFATPVLPRNKRRKSESEFSPDLFAGNSSAFSDNTFFEEAISEGVAEAEPVSDIKPPPATFATPSAPPSKARVRNLIEETSDDENQEEQTSPVFGGTRLFQRVKVKTAAFRSPKKKNRPSEASPNLGKLQVDIVEIFLKLSFRYNSVGDRK